MNLNQHTRSVSTPAGGAAATTPPIDHTLDIAALGQNVIFYVDAPALTVSQLPNGQTITYTLVESNNSDLSSPISSTVMGVQTGAGGAGAAAQTFAARAKYAGGRYVGMKVTASATANAAGVSVSLGVAQTVARA